MSGLTLRALCPDLPHELRHSLDSKIDPLPEVRVLKIAKLQILLRIQASLILERCDRCVIKTCPGVFPSVEVRHPVGNVHIDAVDARARDLSYSLHVCLPPVLRVRTDPHVFIARTDPERCSGSENRRLACDLPLQPVRMILHHGMRGFVRIRRDAFCPRDIHKRLVPALCAASATSRIAFSFSWGRGSSRTDR